MKIGMEFRDTGISNVDFTNIEIGNPGCGGTQFEFALLAHHLLKLNSGFEIVFFHFSDNKFESGIKSIRVKEINDIPFMAKKENVDILLFWATHDNEWYENIQKHQIKSIAWAHNFLTYLELSRIKSCDMVKRVVAVSREQYELMAGEDVFLKSTYISNMLDFEASPYDRTEALENNIVCCIGTLIKAKGFHILAKQWKNIIKKVPSAQLYVIGNGNLYDENAELGKYGLAEALYENYFMKYLLDGNGNILPSVHFLGNVGIEKINIFRKCKVGVVNPNGIETFCISAVEMEAEGVPVCSKNANGLIDTVANKKTGFLSNTPRELRNNIIRLLVDDKLNIKMGKQAVKHAQKFSGDIVIDEWNKLFNDVLANKKPITKGRLRNYFGRVKWLRVIVRKMRGKKLFRFIPEPSYISFMILNLKRTLVKIRNMILARD